MSFDNYSAAWRTKLGNITAKSLLVNLVDEGNAEEGLGFASEKRMAELTEIKRRTVIRMISVFEAIGLVTRTTAVLKGRMRRAFQVNLQMLGTDLSVEFRAAYAEAMGTARRKKCRSDTLESVAATRKSVVATRKSVAATLPPNPLIGGPLLVPLLSLSPPNPPQAGGDAPKEPAENPGLDAEQQACVDRHRNGGHEEMARQWEAHFREENARTAREQREREERVLAEVEQRAKRRAEMPTAEAAVVWTMRECGWVRSRRGRGLETAIRDAIEQTRLAEPWETAVKLAATWNGYLEAMPRLRHPTGPIKFIRQGMWRDQRTWPWKEWRAG